MHERCADFRVLGINKNVLDMMVLRLAIERNSGGSMPGYDLPRCQCFRNMKSKLFFRNDAFTTDKVPSTTLCGKTVVSVEVQESLSLMVVSSSECQHSSIYDQVLLVSVIAYISSFYDDPAR